MKEGWKYVKLLDICTLRTGKHDANHSTPNGRYRFYTCSAEYSYCDTSRFDGYCIILPGNGVNVGEVFNYNGQFDAYQRTYVLTEIDQSVSGAFLYYQMKYGWRKYGTQKQYGAATNYIKLSNFQNYKIPLPPLSEQEEIVTYLDTSFAKIDAIKTNAEKELEEAKKLFAAALNEAMTPKEGWVEKTLGEIASDMYRGSGIKRDQVTEDGIQCLRYGEIYTTYNYYFDKCVSHTNEELIRPKKYFENGDLLFAITGESVEDIGKTIAYVGEGKCLLGGDIVAMKHNQDAKFMAYALATDNAIKQKGFGKTKLKVVHTNIPSLKQIKIALPTSLEIQHSIVTHLDTLSEKVRQLQSNYEKISSECDALKQAILIDTFE